MAIVSISVVPLGTGTPSLSRYVARAVKIAESQKDIKCALTPMGTVLEGDLTRILEVVRQMHESVFDEAAPRVLTSIKIDDRRDKPGHMADKIKSVRNQIKSGHNPPDGK